MLRTLRSSVNTIRNAITSLVVPITSRLLKKYVEQVSDLLALERLRD